MKKNEDYNMLNRIRHELSISHKHCILLRGTKIVIPKKLRKSTIKLAHAGHQGIVKTKQLLRETVWFSGIDKLTENLVSSCIAYRLITSLHHYRLDTHIIEGKG